MKNIENRVKIFLQTQNVKCLLNTRTINHAKLPLILISVSHRVDLTAVEIHCLIKDNVIEPVLREYKQYIKDTHLIINPSGKFTIWGSFGDSGCVGRKIVVDTYGGIGRVGGGCFFK